MQGELEKSKDAVVEATNRKITAGANVKLLNTSLGNHKKDVSRLKTELVAAKARVAD